MPAHRKKIRNTGKRWTATRVHPAIARVSATLEGVDDCLWFLLRGDAHHDNPHSDHDLQREHLEEAVRRGACICDLGDLSCAMGGKADPRMVKHGVTRPEHAMANDYFDSITRHNADFLLPYAHYIGVMGEGNHETSVRKRHEICLTTRIVERINTKTGASVIKGGYGGWIHICLEQHGSHVSMWLRTHHGHGGGGMMTFGSLSNRRMASYIPDADVIASGHIHERWAMELSQETVRCDGGVYAIEYKPQWHVRTGCYKQEYDPNGGWHVERGAPPKPLGGYWMRVSVDIRKHEGRVTRRPRIELVAT